MTSSKGVVLIARNNGKIDYIKHAVFLAERIKKYLDLPTSIITDSVSYIEQNYDRNCFDRVIENKIQEKNNVKQFSDGTLYQTPAAFKNYDRANVFDLTPYDKTLLIDTDYIISSNLLKNCFDTNNSIMMYKKSIDLSFHRDTREFKFISDYGIDFYWATAVYFCKNQESKIFFDLVKHIQEEYNHYRKVFQISSTLFRNDFAFSIATHILNGFAGSDFVKELPGKKCYTIDRDILLDIRDETLTFLIEKEKYLGEYTAISTKDTDVHVMNKFSLDRILDKRNNK